ncbi:MAG: hypothetical protein NVS9B10_15330 [Nevskia sp.]
MRRTHAAVACGLLAASGLAGATDATVEESDRITLVSTDYISVLGGYALPDTDRGVKRRGETFGFIYGNQISPHFAVEGHVQASIFDTGKHRGSDFYQWGSTVDLVYGFNDRRLAGITPFALLGVGAIRDEVVDKSRSRSSFIANAGAGFVTRPLIYNVKLRGEGRYTYDTYASGYHDFRVSLGFEIPLGLVHEHLIVKKSGDRVEVREVVKEVPRPFVDSDGDTVADELDQCPDTPKGLRVDAAGCIIAGQIIELRGVTFDYNTARLQPNAQSVLDIAVRAMLGQRSLVVELAGHTDSRGSAAYNKKLSQARAEAVREYMVDKGVAADHLTAIGYGKSQLKVSPEKTEADRELNRRVEFRVLVK